MNSKFEGEVGEPFWNKTDLLKDMVHFNSGT